jgi:hypothetical protein
LPSLERQLDRCSAGGRKVAGSNPVAPTSRNRRKCGSFVGLGRVALARRGVHLGSNFGRDLAGASPENADQDRRSSLCSWLWSRRSRVRIPSLTLQDQPANWTNELSEARSAGELGYQLGTNFGGSKRARRPHKVVWTQGRRRTAEIRSQRLVRTAHPAGGSFSQGSSSLRCSNDERGALARPRSLKLAQERGAVLDVHGVACRLAELDRLLEYSRAGVDLAAVQEEHRS